MNNDVIAVVAGNEITETDFAAFTKNLPAQQQAYLQNPEAVAYLKSNLSHFTFLQNMDVKRN